MIMFSFAATGSGGGESEVREDDLGVILVRPALSEEDVVRFDVPVDDCAVLWSRLGPSDGLVIARHPAGDSLVDEGEGFGKLLVGVPDEAFRDRETEVVVVLVNHIEKIAIAAILEKEVVVGRARGGPVAQLDDAL